MNSTICPADMSSVEVLHTQNDSGSFPSNEFSMLPDADSIPNGDINHHINDKYNLTNMQSSLNATLSDPGIDVHAQLSELMEENIRLKEILGKNNSLMEEQIGTIQSWRDHMITSKYQLEEKIKKASERIVSLEQLEKDNSELHEKVTQLIKMNEEQKVKTCMKCTTFETSLTAMLGVDYMEENGGIILGWSDFQENLCSNLKTVCQHLETYKSSSEISEGEKYLLECYILLMKFKIAFMEGSDASQLQTDYSLKTDEETGYEVVCKRTLSEDGQKEIKELTEQLKDKDNQLTCLTKEKEECAEKIKENELKMQEWDMKLKSQFEIMSNKLKIESNLTQQYRERCETFQQQVEEYKVKLDQTRSSMDGHIVAKNSDDQFIQDLHEEVHNLQEILKLEQQVNQTDKEKISELMDKFEKLQVDYIRVTQILEIQRKDEKEKRKQLALRENAAKKFMEDADFQTAKLLMVQEELSETRAELRILKEELKEINNQENISILKDQISSYKREYKELEAAKNAASDEVERLKNELKKCERSPPRKSHSSRSCRGRFSDQMDQTGGAAEPLTCPICQKGFLSENALQNHVNKCLEENP